MARFLGELDWNEFQTLQDCIIGWLEKNDVAGSSRGFSIYQATKGEWQRARAAYFQEMADVEARELGWGDDARKALLVRLLAAADVSASEVCQVALAACDRLAVEGALPSTPLRRH